MKKTVLPLILAFLLTTPTMASSIEAAQIVSRELKSWARDVAAGKPSAEIATIPDSVAVLYFSNQTGRQDIAPLQKGLSLMLSTDLSAIKGIRVVERARVQALYEALGLNPSKPISTETALRLGKMLGAFYVVSGNLVRGRITDLKITVNLAEVPNDMLLDRPVSAGDLADLVYMEKEILFDLINALQLTLKPTQLKALEKPVSEDIDALYLLFRGINTSDRGKYEAAADLYKKALHQDPQLAVASSALKELQVKVFPAQVPQPSPVPVEPALAATPPVAVEARTTAPPKVQPPATKPPEAAPTAVQPLETKTVPEVKTAPPDANSPAASPPQPAPGTPASPADEHKLSTGTIVAIGLGAAAVIGGVAAAAGGGGGGGGGESPPDGTSPPEPVPQAPRITSVGPPAESEVSCTAGTATFTFDKDMDTSAGQIGVSVADWQFSGSFSNARTYVITWDDNCPESGSPDDLPASITFVFADFQDISQTPLEGDVEFTFNLAI